MESNELEIILKTSTILGTDFHGLYNLHKQESFDDSYFVILHMLWGRFLLKDNCEVANHDAWELMECKMMDFEWQGKFLQQVRGAMALEGQPRNGEKKAKCWVHRMTSASFGGQILGPCKAKSRWMKDMKYDLICKEQGCVVLFLDVPPGSYECMNVGNFHSREKGVLAK